MIWFLTNKDVPATPKDYGAAGDGATDDTEAFRQALAENRTVHVPGGRYVISDTLVVRENCCLELSQDTVLEFVNEEKNGIALLRAAHLKGNHATITVPYTFAANVIHCDTGEDEAALGVDATDDEAMKAANNTAVPPFVKWDPQWKMTRYVTDINICKPDDRGFHYSKDGDCFGTAISLHCDAAATLFTRIDETHAGTEDDSIPYSGNMALENGKYYIQDYAIYRCIRDTGNPVYHPLADLVGVYVELVG